MQDEPTTHYTIALTAHEMEVLWNLLMRAPLPYVQSKPLVDKLTVAASEPITPHPIPPGVQGYAADVGSALGVPATGDIAADTVDGADAGAVRHNDMPDTVTGVDGPDAADDAPPTVDRPTRVHGQFIDTPAAVSAQQRTRKQ